MKRAIFRLEDRLKELGINDNGTFNLLTETYLDLKDKESLITELTTSRDNLQNEKIKLLAKNEQLKELYKELLKEVRDNEY